MVERLHTYAEPMPSYDGLNSKLNSWIIVSLRGQEMDQTLTRVQKNEIFESLFGRGLDPSEFEWGKTGSDYTPYASVSTLRHRDTGYFFKFDIYDSSFRLVAKPGPTTPLQDLGLANWDEVGYAAAAWADRVKENLEAPLLWETFSSQRQVVQQLAAAAGSNAPFTASEIKQLDMKLEQIKDRVFDIMKGQAQSAEEVARLREHITNQFVLLHETNKRYGRKEWATFALGTVVTLGLDFAKDPTTIERLFKNVFGMILEFFKLFGLGHNS